MILSKHLRFSRLLLVTTACFAVLSVDFEAHAAFDPAYGSDSSVAISNGDVLYPQRARTLPTTQGYISPLAPVQMPRPLYPSRMANAAPTPPSELPPAAGAHYEPTPMPALPPSLPAPVAANTQSFVAPAPILAQTDTAAAAPIVATTPEITVESAAATVAEKEAAPAPTAPITPAAPVTTAPVVASAPAPAFIAPAPVLANVLPAAIPATTATPSAAPKVPPVAVAAAQPKPQPSPDALSSQTKSILASIPSKLDTVASKSKSQKIAMERANPEVKEAFAKDKDNKVETYNANGLSIKVSRPGLDTGFELNRAYTMLMGGQTQDAVDVYKNILASEPSNQDALFGLAATYHRLGELEKARPLYGALLKLNPNNREALNNFLVLVSDESPQQALAELERLEQRNPDFSPIPAQEAILMDKLGYTGDARTKMLRAIELAPENLTYKYNLAIMLDRQGNYADAGALYRLLIDAALKGEKIPSTLETLQKRLNFITTAAVTTPQGV